MQWLRVASHHPTIALDNAVDPEERWHYGMATDVAGHLVEIISGLPSADYFDEKIFEPLGMEDTAFYVPKAKEPRLAALYGPVDGNKKACFA